MSLVTVGFFQVRFADNNGHVSGGAAVCITYRQVCCRVVLSFSLFVLNYL